MTQLIEAARRRGLREMVGYVLAENQPMLRLASRVGFEVARDPDDFTARICRLELQEAAGRGKSPARARRGRDAAAG